MARHGASIAVALLAATSVAGAAHAQIRPGEQQGLGLIGPETPEVLKHAQADPYAAPAEPACMSLPQELAALEEVLGPDVAEPPKRIEASRLIGRAIRGLIPHRDVMRFITGAGRKEKALARAAMAGWARRGYLKGLAQNLDCSTRIASAGDVARPAAAIAPVLIIPTATALAPAADLAIEPDASVNP